MFHVEQLRHLSQAMRILRRISGNRETARDASSSRWLGATACVPFTELQICLRDAQRFLCTTGPDFLTGPLRGCTVPQPAWMGRGRGSTSVPSQGAKPRRSAPPGGACRLGPMGKRTTVADCAMSPQLATGKSPEFYRASLRRYFLQTASNGPLNLREGNPMMAFPVPTSTPMSSISLISCRSVVRRM